MLRAFLTGQDVLAVLPIGAGTSLVFQIASQALPGLTIVISSLLATTDSVTVLFGAVGFKPLDLKLVRERKPHRADRIADES